MWDALLSNFVLGLFAVLLGVGALAAATIAAEHRRRGRAVARTTITPLARCAGERVKVQGTVEEPAEPIVSPLDGARCAWLEVTLCAARGSGSSREVRDLAKLRLGDALHFRDATGRGLVDLRQATLELAVTLERSWPELGVVPVPAVRALVGDDLERLAGQLDGWSVEYTERRILPGEPLHVTGLGVPSTPASERAVYRAALPYVRFLAAGDEAPIAALAKKEALAAHHRHEAGKAALLCLALASVSGFLLWAWIAWQPL